jgi:hypothetical protein
METQKERIFEHLKSGRTITPLEALNLYGCFRLGDVIFKLRSEGKNISTTINKDGKKYAIYTLLPPEETGRLDLFADVKIPANSAAQA